jgi:hypothetical protein
MKTSRVRPRWRKSSRSTDNGSSVEIIPLPEASTDVSNPENSYDEIPPATAGEWRVYVARARTEDQGGPLRSQDKLRWEAIQDWGRTLRYCLIVLVTTLSGALLLWLAARG